MEVLMADYLGFCYGVKRAIKIAKEHVSTEDNPAATLGPIIHNPQMVERLKNDGVGAINSLDEMNKGTVIIRSHGVGPAVYDKAEQKGLAVVDATCPHVRRAQLAARDLVNEGYSVVIVGEKNHPEVKSIFEWTNGSAIIAETVEEAETVTPAAKLGIVSQTTFSGENFKAIVLKLLDKSQELKIERTICTATDQRQKATMDLASKVDLMLVIGGKNSANTTRLYQLCAEKCTTYHIETAKELVPQWFDNVNKIGITAGASTPDWIIKEVYEQCQKR